MAALCIAIAISIYQCWQPLKHRMLWLYWSHQVAKHTMPQQATESIYREYVDAIRIPTTNPDYVTFSTPGEPLVAMYVPESFRELLPLDSRLSMAGWNNGIAFVGTVYRPDGTPRLVIVTGGTGITSRLLGVIPVEVLPLPGLFDSLPPAFTRPIQRLSVGYAGASFTVTRLRTGITDPNDSSHIIFEFTAGPIGKRGVVSGTTTPNTITGGGIIDAYLQNDDSVAFKLRSSWGLAGTPNLGHARIAGDMKSLEIEAQSLPRANSSPGPSTAPQGSDGN